MHLYPWFPSSLPITPAPALPLSCAQLNLMENKIGPDGAAALAPAIAVSSSLTHLDVQFNSLGEEGEAVLRKAVEGRSGLELKL